MTETGEKVAEASVKWLQNHIDQFNPDANEFFDPVRWEALVEVAILGSIFPHWANKSFDSFLKEVANFIGELLHQGVIEDFAFCNTCRFNECLHLLYFYSHRLKAEVPKPLIAKLIQHPHAFKMERPPHQLLALRIASDAIGVTHSLPEVSSLYSRTVFAKWTHPWRLSHSDVKCLWITVWALTLGVRIGDYRLHQEDRERLCWTINNLFWTMLFEQRLVSACKLILCMTLVGLKSSPAWMATVNLLATNQQTDGSIVDPAAKKQKPDQCWQGTLFGAAALLIKEVC